VDSQVSAATLRRSTARRNGDDTALTPLGTV
jgi:hypothetical protein